jgi:hypothetical protein
MFRYDVRTMLKRSPARNGGKRVVPSPARDTRAGSVPSVTSPNSLAGLPPPPPPPPNRATETPRPIWGRVSEEPDRP